MKKIFLIAPVLFLMACGETEETNEPIEEVVTTVEETIPEPEVVETVTSSLSSDESIKAFLEGKSWESEEPHASGLYVVIDEAGEGDARPDVTDEVTIFYQGYLLDGFKFDGTQEMPLTYPLNGFIRGWQIGIPMFGKGGKGKLIIPPDLAYGDRDNGAIPAGSTLMFEVELVDWKSAQ